MFPPERLGKLSPAHRLRKTALLLTAIEGELLAASRRPGGEAEAARLGGLARAYAAVLAALPETPPSIREAALRLGASEGEALLRSLDALRHGLFREGGQDRADWDLLDPDTGLVSGPRRPRPGLRAYLEDIRSPFNVGSMLRSAEAFGLEELLLSPASADPLHPRAARSAMGAAALLPWRRAGLGALGDFGPAFALELGGTPIDDFDFPEGGIVVVGSEELGVSRQALELCGRGRVSIPMRGAKASLNVGVAFGILLAAWNRRLDRSEAAL